jgi:hypothetical protein
MPDCRTLPGRLRTRRRGIEDRIARRVLRIVGAADGAGQRDDRRELRELLPRVRELQGDRVWAVADLALDRLIDRADGQRIGRLLARNAGTVIGDLVLHSLGSDRDGRLWCLRRVHR